MRSKLLQDSVEDRRRDRRRRKGVDWCCCCGILLLILLLALGLGLGLGLGLQRQDPSTTTTTNTTTFTTTTPLPTTTTTSVTTTPAALCNEDVNNLYITYSILYADPSDQLILRNPVTNLTQFIGVLDIPADVLFVEPITNELWGGVQNATGNYIFRINKSTAQTTLVCFFAQQFEAFTGIVTLSFQSNGVLWMFANNGLGAYIFYTVDVVTCIASPILTNAPASVTGTFFNYTSTNDVFYLQKTGTNILYKAIVSSTPGVLVGNTGIFTSGGVALRLFSYCLNDVPTLEMFWQVGVDNFQFRQLNPATGSVINNNVTFVLGGNINPHGISPGCYCP
jgi:hypothetical protein